MSGVVLINDGLKENFRLAQALRKTLGGDPVSADCTFVTSQKELADVLDADSSVMWSVVKIDNALSAGAVVKTLNNVSTIAIAKKGLAEEIKADYVFRIPFMTRTLVPAIKSIVDYETSLDEFDFGGFHAAFGKNGALRGLTFGDLDNQQLRARLMGPQREILASLVRRAAAQSVGSNEDFGTMSHMFCRMARHTPDLDFDVPTCKRMAMIFGKKLADAMSDLTHGRLSMLPVIDPDSKSVIDYTLTDAGTHAGRTAPRPTRYVA